jgi:cobalt-zinc-cadmium efflux system protein
MVLELAGGLLTRSLALLADAGHMFSDAGSLTLAYIATRFASRPANARKTYGYFRAEILAALVNGVTLVVVAILVFVEAAGRFDAPPQVRTIPMLAIAIAGLLVNVVSAIVLSGARKASLNIRGAFLHVLGDALGSLATIVAAIIMLTTGEYLADPLISVLIGVLILLSSWGLVRESVNVLMEGTPAGVDAAQVQAALVSMPGISRVHDLHIWTLTTGFDAVSVHVVVERNLSMEESQALLDRVHGLVHDRFGIEHTTIQLEYSPPGRNATVVM